jgi:hypothetical protein
VDPGSIPAHIALQAFQTNGITLAGTGDIDLNADGHIAEFVPQLIPSISTGFTGVLDIKATTPFAVLTIRSLINSRNDFLFTLFPTADLIQPAPSPILFPQIADGEGYQSEFILLSAGTAGSSTLSFFDNTGNSIAVGQNP